MKQKQVQRFVKISNLTRQSVLAHSVEVADHAAARNKGLLGRASLLAGEGLWIVPCSSVHTFWMKFPIDLVYLDRNKRVKKIRSNVRPWRASACLLADSVIELPAGTIHATLTQAGDCLEFSRDRSPLGPDLDRLMEPASTLQYRNTLRLYTSHYPAAGRVYNR